MFIYTIYIYISLDDFFNFEQDKSIDCHHIMAKNAAVHAQIVL